MANTQATFGFKHIGYLSGGAADYQLTTRAIQSSNASAIGFGDPVMKSNATSQYIVQAVASTTPTQPIIGIFAGCSYRPAGGIPAWSPFWPGAAAADAVAYIVDAPNALFLAASLLTAITTSMIGQVVNFTGGAPSTTGGGFSIATLDQATVGTAAGGTAASGLPFRVVQLYQGVGNGSDPSSNYNWVVVGFNNQVNRALSA